ncbi:MAG: ComEC/Rec2 family competence protein, partial [Gemmatimonadales bacterium]|nr:ComEC/Rec2 family competence protein [Gemmatimonadales bacterium]
MRPCSPVLFTAAYGAGLATGLLRFGTPLGATAVALALALTGRPLPLLLGSAALVGRLSAEVAWLAERPSCQAQFAQATLRFRVRVVEPVDGAGGRIAVRPLVQNCAGSVMARWPRGHSVAAGSEVAVEGKWVPRAGPGGRPGGTLAVRHVGAIHPRPSPADRLRTYLYQTSHRLYGARAGMVDALILGRRGGIDPDLQDRFAWSGLVHLLSISGFHVGLITAWIVLLGRAARLGRSRALLLAAATSVA